MGNPRDPAKINLLVIHCSATKNGQWITAEEIDQWHALRGFKRDMRIAPYHQPQLQHIGYHFVIYTTGAVVAGRPVRETGAHVEGHNRDSIGICMVGLDQFTSRQWESLKELVSRLSKDYPSARICGHRDLSPDIDGDGIVEQWEWLKTCPGFSVEEWLKNHMEPAPDHLLPDVEIRPAADKATGYYKIKSGDSLWKIAHDHGVSVNDLKSWNGLTGDRILVGQNLIIKSGGKSNEERV